MAGGDVQPGRNILTRLGSVFVVWHAGLLLYGNLPRAPVYPADGGVAALRRVDQGLVSLYTRLHNPMSETYVRALRMDQQWLTFAPLPITGVWLSVIGYGPNDKATVLWSTLPPAPRDSTSHYGAAERLLEQLPVAAKPIRAQFTRYIVDHYGTPGQTLRAVLMAHTGHNFEIQDYVLFDTSKP